MGHGAYGEGIMDRGRPTCSERTANQEAGKEDRHGFLAGYLLSCAGCHQHARVRLCIAGYGEKSNIAFFTYLEELMGVCW